MYIFLQAESPNGANANYHRVAKAEMVDSDQVTLVINSYSTDSSDMIIWQEMVIMPMRDFQLNVFPENAYNWLISPTGLFSGGALLSDLTNLETLKKKKKTIINSTRDKLINSGYQTSKGKIDTDRKSLQNIMLACQHKFNKTIKWRMYDDSVAEISYNELLLVGKEVNEYVKQCYEKSWELKNLIDSSKNEADLDKVDLTFF